MHKSAMLRKLAASILLWTWLLSGCVTTYVSGAERTTQFRRPVKLWIDRLVKKRFKEYFKGAKWNQLLIEQFYPIGWSRDGKLAYLVEPADEECGCYFARIAVRDLRTDKTLWEVKYDGEGEEEGKPKESLITFWRANQTEFSKKLSEYKIETIRPFVLLDPKINLGGDVVVPELRIKRDPESLGFGQITSVTLQVVSKQRGRKLVYEQMIPREEYNGLLDAQVIGHLRSPFEPLAAYVVIEIQRGWEGPPHITSIRIVGSSLINGFQK